MHVPYSMDDNEPDLYGSLGGRQEDGECEGNSYSLSNEDQLEIAVRAFRQGNYSYTQEDMNNLIQKNLKKVQEYRNEIEELLGLLSYIYNHSETLPQGASQKIREQITMERIWEKE